MLDSIWHHSLQSDLKNAASEGRALLADLILVDSKKRHPFIALFPGQPGSAGTRKTILVCNEARDDGVAVASAGPYESHLYLTADRWPQQHLIARFFTSRMLFLMPHQQCQSIEEQVKWLTLKTGGIINNSAVWLRVNIICNVVHCVLLLLSRYASRLLQSVRRNLWMHRNEGSCHSTVKVSALFLHSFFAEKWCLSAELYTSFSKGVC